MNEKYKLVLKNMSRPPIFLEKVGDATSAAYFVNGHHVNKDTFSFFQNLAKDGKADLIPISESDEGLLSEMDDNVIMVPAPDSYERPMLTKTIKPGIYRVYSTVHRNDAPDERLLARIMIKGKSFDILEDHDGVFQETLPGGFFANEHHKTFWKIMYSPYFRVVLEKDVDQGHHEELIPEFDLGPHEADSNYLLEEPGMPPKQVEMFGENVLVDGKLLSEAEKEIFKQTIHMPNVVLRPI